MKTRCIPLLLVLALVLALAPVASATIEMTIYRLDDTTANILVTGDDSETQGSFGPGNPTQRWARTSFINDATHVLFATQGTDAIWTYTSSTISATGGNTLEASGSTRDYCYNNLGGESKLLMAFTLNPAVGHTVTGEVFGVALPAGWTWGTVGTTGIYRWGQNNSGTSQQDTGTWIIAAGATTGNLTIKKFFDCDQNGVKDYVDDKYLPNWEYQITGPGGYDQTLTTDAGGQIALTGLDPGDYTVTETVWQDHSITGGKSNPTIVTIAGGDDKTELFGNVLNGDINQDGIVDSVDFTFLKANYGLTPKTWVEGNLNPLEDTLVDSIDFTILKAYYGKGVPPPPAGVPEPATLALLAIGACLPLLRRRK